MKKIQLKSRKRAFKKMSFLRVFLEIGAAFLKKQGRFFLSIGRFFCFMSQIFGRLSHKDMRQDFIPSKVYTRNYQWFLVQKEKTFGTICCRRGAIFSLKLQAVHRISLLLWYVTIKAVGSVISTPNQEKVLQFHRHLNTNEDSFRQNSPC